MTKKSFPYHKVAIAGTFDRLHRGHRHFINQAFHYGEKVIIGLTSDKYIEKNSKLPPSPRLRRAGKTQKSKISPQMRDPAAAGQIKIQNYIERKRAAENFLKERNILKRAQILPIDDVYGPAIEENSGIEALLVTSETLDGGRLVNRKRVCLGLSKLKLIKIAMIKADDQRRISSTRVRMGEIDRWGRVFATLPVYDKTISLSLKVKLKRPLGELIKGNPKHLKSFYRIIEDRLNRKKPLMVVAVGDVVTRLLNDIEMTAGVSIIDFHINRKRVYKNISDLGFPLKFDGNKNNLVTVVRNPASNVRKTLVIAIKKSIKKHLVTAQKYIVQVLGEEDLAGLPAVLLSPLGSVVLYGQPKEGIVWIEVTEEKKEEIIRIIGTRD